MKKVLFSLLFLLILVPFSVNSAEIITETVVELDQNNNYSENLYVGAGKTNISSPVDSDLTVLGGEINVTSNVTGDIFIAGGKVNFSGQVVGDLRVIGGDVIVSGQVMGDLLIIGGNVFVTDQANLSSDILLIGGEINFESNSSSKLKVVSNSIRINSEIGGESEITTQNLFVGPRSIIDGDFSYYSPQKFIKQDEAQILGNINYNEINAIRDTGVIKKTIINFLSFWILLKFITTLIIGFLLVYLFRVFSTGVSNIVYQSFWKSLLTGFLVLLFAPILIILFFISLVAMPIGFLILIMLIFISIIIPAVSGIFIGAWIRKKIHKTSEYLIDFHSVAIGVVFLTLIQFIPTVDILFKIVISLVTLGAIYRYIYRSIIK